MKTLNAKLFLIILLLGVFLRLSYLGAIPSGFFRDEAAIGYNAFSVWRTGMDEYGFKFPLFFRSFEVFFLPLYLYATAPLVGILGLSELTTRLLSSLSGIAALVIIYLTAKRLGNAKTAIFSMFLLVISPWHIFYSRGAFEGNLAMTLFSLGFFFYLLFYSQKSIKYFYFSLLAFVLSMYSYQAERVVVPLFGALAVIINFKDIWKIKEKLVIPAVAALLILVPMLLFTFKAAGLHRAAGVSLFNKDPEGWNLGSENDLLVDNRFYLRSRQITGLYLSYFSPRNLFFEGDYDRERSTENFSVFYAWTLPILLVGLYVAVKSKNPKYKLLLVWLLVAPIPAALTGDPFHTYRSLLTYLPLTLLMGIGMGALYNLVKKKAVFIIAFTGLAVISLAFFIYDYAVITQTTRARNWDYGYKQIVSYLDSQDFKRVVVDDMWTEPYINFLFFEKEDPGIYQREVSALGDLNNYYYSSPERIRPNKFGDYEFRKVDWPKERGDTGTVFVFSEDELPESEFKNDPKVELLKYIYFPDGKVAYRIVRIN